MQFFNRSLPLVALGLTTFQLAFAKVRLPKVFASHMVLQRSKPVPVWGWAEAGEKVTVTFSTQTKTVQTAPDGRWQVKLDPMEAGGPYQLTVRGNTTALTLDDVLLGEVWICSGQSNMEWRLAQVTNAPAEIASARYPQIRQFLVKKALSLTPKTNLDGTWSVCSPETAPNFTAVGYFFGRELTKEL
ncbi:MAG: sialate O-acetylesterase, partial [Sphingobacteriaceae bacterium]|nr:sialate O-acetylesterase [Cytophagaceae bacterium]